MERRWQVLAVVSVAVFMVSLDLFIVNIAFPDIERDFNGSSVAALSWVLNAYTIVVAALMVPAGRFADRVGRRRVFLAGLLVFLLGSALCAAAPSVETLIAARALQAVGAACLLPTSLALLLPEFPAEERPAAIGIWAAVGAVAATAGPPLGGLLVEGSWRWVFIVNLPVGAVAFAYARRLLRESRDESQQRPDVASAAIFAAAIGVLALALVKAPAWGWGGLATLGCLAGSAAGLAWFAARCRSHPSPVVEPALLKVRSFAMANLASLLFASAFSAMLLSSVLFLTGVWHYSILSAGLHLFPGPLMAAVWAVPTGKLANRVGQRRLASAGIAIFGLGVATWMWRIGAERPYLSEMLPGQLMTGTGVGLTLPSLASAAATSLPAARFGTGSAVHTMSRQLGFVLGVAILVAVLGTVDRADPVSSFQHAWIFMIIVAALGSAAAFAIGEVRQPASDSPERAATEARSPGQAWGSPAAVET
jgi:EmrB/QacA subfamily drug resistance transporter